MKEIEEDKWKDLLVEDLLLKWPYYPKQYTDDTDTSKEFSMCVCLL